MWRSRRRCTRRPPGTSAERGCRSGRGGGGGGGGVGGGGSAPLPPPAAPKAEAPKAEAPKAEQAAETPKADAAKAEAPQAQAAQAEAPAAAGPIEVKVPDIGDFKEVEVIEVLVAEGDTIKAEQSLITVESDKASMEIPASAGGVVQSLKVKVGDKVAMGTVIAVVQGQGAAAAPAAAEPAAPASPVA
ncbi:biotin/lipoyl-containing protein, partial [Bordetella pertussis]|uniref:biotin/lipoyl-containing protein n=1 Tax=Bordetella pertussis TaxID=520 RepID=UPI00366AB4CC